MLRKVSSAFSTVSNPSSSELTGGKKWYRGDNFVW